MIKDDQNSAPSLPHDIEIRKTSGQCNLAKAASKPPRRGDEDLHLIHFLDLHESIHPKQAVDLFSFPPDRQTRDHQTQ